ncbi:MAG: PIN domain-containing protein [archaeon]|nr:MAG: PIN domain-containing protein [archaeon]
MSIQGEGRENPPSLLCDTDVFFFYLKGGRCQVQAELVLKSAEEGELELRTSSEVYDDAITAIRADGLPLEVAQRFVADIKSFRQTSLPMTPEIAEDALDLYRRHGGRRRLSYFDSFHVATARRYDLPLLTSDRYVLEESETLGLKVWDLARWERHQPDRY